MKLYLNKYLTYSLKGVYYKYRNKKEQYRAKQKGRQNYDEKNLYSYMEST